MTAFQGPMRARVVENEDPDGMARVRVEIPGIIDKSAWAMQLGMAGGAGRGFFEVPGIDAEVVVLAVDGDPDQLYYASTWGGDEAPPESGGSRDVVVVASEKYVVVLDDRGAGKLAIRHRLTGDGVEHDGATLTTTIKAATRLDIRVAGAVNITAAVITLNGRPVGPGGAI